MIYKNVYKIMIAQIHDAWENYLSGGPSKYLIYNLFDLD